MMLECRGTQGQEAEIRKPKAELKRMTEERDILKKRHACMNRTLPRRPGKVRIYPGT